MGEPSVTVLLWNLARRRPTSPAGAAARRIIEQADCDIVCLVESHIDFLGGGYRIQSADDFGLGPKKTERKVLLWSRWPWHGVDLNGSGGLPVGRYVSGRTATPIGPIRFHGLCVPWRGAGRAVGTPTWSAHGACLAALQDMLTTGVEPRTVLLGDFNQPLKGGNAPPPLRVARDRLMSLGRDVASAGPPETAIDHLLALAGVAILESEVLPRRGIAGEALSDHDGMIVRLGPA